MDVYLIRHTKAAALGSDGIATDEERPLTAEGEAQARRLAQTFAHLQTPLDVVVTTPLFRARRTGEILIENWWSEATPELVVSEKIAPECKPRKLARLLRKLNKERVAVVGHQPDMSTWAAWLIGSKDAYVDFAKGGAAYIYWESELKKGNGALIWLITPKWYAGAPEPSENTDLQSVG